MGAVNVTGFPLEWDAVINTDSFDKQLQGLNQRIAQSTQRQAKDQELINAAQKEYARLIIQSGQAFSKLDSGIQSQIKQLGALQDELEKVRAAQGVLQGKKDLGIVGTETAANSMAALVNKEKELSQAIENLSQDMRMNDAIMKAASGSIVQKTLELEALKRKYIELSEADRIDINVGGNILNQIQSLDQELSVINSNFKKVQENAAGSINQKTALLSKLKDDYAALSEVDRNSDIGAKMLQNIHKVDEEVRILNQSFQAVQQNAVGSLNAKIAELQRLKSEYAALSEVDRKGNIGKNLANNIKGLDKEVAKINSEFQKTDTLANKAALAIGAYLSLSAGTNFIKDIVRVRGEFQQLEVAFTTMLGSKEKADKLMKEVTEFAATTPFGLKEVADASKQLLAFGIGADKIKSTLRSLGDIAAGLGQPIGEIAYLFGTIKTAGVANSVDLKQFAQRGIPIYEELAKVLGVAVDRVGDLVSAGKIGFPEIEKAFQNLTAEGSKFGGLMEAQSHTLTGQLSNLSDAWSQMLNDIGKSGEGVFSSAIGAASSLVENYQTVLDVLKVLVLTYGSYKAAVIATTAVTSVYDVATKRLLISQTLQATAQAIASKTMALLNKTMLANPYVALATGLAAVVSALVVFTKTTSNAEKAQEALNEVRTESQKILQQEKQKLEDLLKIAKDETQSRETRLKAMKKVNDLYPETLGNLTLEKLKTNEGTKAIDDYIKALDRKAKAQAANAVIEKLYQEKIEEAAKAGTGENVSFFNKLLGKGLDLASNTVQGQAFVIAKSAENTNEALDTIDAKIKAIKETYKDDLTAALLGEDGKQEAKKRTIKIIDDEITALKKRQAEESSTHEQKVKFDQDIKKLEDEKRKITGATKEDIRNQQAEENRTNKLLEQRKDILQTIEDLKRDASQSGLVKEQSEIDKINEKYDQTLRKVTEYNEKVSLFNKKNGTSVQGIGLVDVNAINDARNQELRNADLKQDAARFKANLELQKGMFEQYEEAKKQIGIEKANQMFDEQRKGFTSYADFLKSEFAKQLPKILLGIGNIGDVEKFKSLMKAMGDETKKQADKQIEEFQQLLQQTANFTDQKQVLDLKYQNFYKTLKSQREKLGEEEYTRRLEAVQQAQAEEETALKNSFTRQTDLYKKLGQDIISFTREDLKKRVAELKKILADGFVIGKDGKKTLLTPEMIAALQSAIQGTEDLLNNTNATSIAAGKVTKELGKVRGALSAATDLAGQFDEGLGEALGKMTSMVDAALDIATAVGQFAAGDIVGGIGSAVSGITKAIGSLFGQSPEEKKRQEELIAFNKNVFFGEFSINELYRERARLALEQYTLTLQRIGKEKELLEQQKAQIEEDFKKVLNELQSQTGQVLGKRIVSAIGDLTQQMNDKITQDLLNSGKTIEEIRAMFAGNADMLINISLKGLSFDQLNEMFMKGQLQGKAKELVETLRELEQQGINVQKLIDENNRATNELFTGTTKDSIADSIADGFSKGLSSAEDFAGTFEDMMKKSILNSLKFKYLEAPLQKFFEEFSSAAKSNEQLSSEEVKQLNDKFNSIINSANIQFQQLQQLSGLDFSSLTGNNANSLQGGIKTIQEETAQLIAGQFGAMRINGLEQLNVAKQALEIHQRIEVNTAQTVFELKRQTDTMINFFRVEGIKLK